MRHSKFYISLASCVRLLDILTNLIMRSATNKSVINVTMVKTILNPDFLPHQR